LVVVREPFSACQGVVRHTTEEETHMTDLLPDTDDTDVRPDRVRPDRRSTARTPRWVYAFAIIAIVVVLLLVVQILMGGNHGPGRHRPSGDAGGHNFGAIPVYVTTMARYPEWLSSMNPLTTTHDTRVRPA